MRSHMISLSLSLLLIAGPSGAAQWTGPAIHALPSGDSCPFGELGTATCNRIALDDKHTSVTLDQAGAKIVFHNAQDYEEETTVADLLVQGMGTTTGDEPVPLSFHLVLSKKGRKWSVNRHAHAPVRGDFSEVTIAPWTVEVNGPDGAQVLLTPQQMKDTLERPSYTARLASRFVDVRDNRASETSPPDITVSLGRGRLAASVLRARLQADADHEDLASLFDSGSWALELKALTSHLPKATLRRELFLYRLDKLALLQPLRRDGLRKNDSLVIGAAKGKGYIRFQGKTVDFPDARAAASAYLQQSFIGLILGSQQSARGGDHPHAH